MFRLIKLAMYGLLGWMIYELYQGMTQNASTGQSGGRSGSSSGRALRRALDEDGGRMSTLTSGGSGTPVQTANADGGTMRHNVGRGVVSR